MYVLLLWPFVVQSIVPDFREVIGPVVRSKGPGLFDELDAPAILLLFLGISRFLRCNGFVLSPWVLSRLAVVICFTRPLGGSARPSGLGAAQWWSDIVFVSERSAGRLALAAAH
ncbi:hypothetical protein F4777DRAFT_577681 [Nemania sp. FL0916]|nr:hypothetical protein F4777DRAFT_577681 [Nemania sp. FL0916]